jgi:N-acetyl-anhydromuramyl-L-alanine amidase AmpD
LDKSLRGFTDAQYTALAALLEDVCGRNGIPMDRQHIIGHQDYSAQRNDPGQLFDWQRILP